MQFLLGLLYANAGEWLMHKYILHGLGGNPRSFWAYHLHEHHAVCAQYAMVDPGYQKPDLATWNTQSKELVVLLGIITLHLPLLFMAPTLAGALYLSLGLYYYKHRRAHLDSAWAKQHLRWHYDHHLCNQPSCSGNWCVTWP
ncbi:MAG: hypothetical protein PHU14_13880, partial [Methylovulum sp.]|nr:hypothetical protein [Methylovulum sp.]